MSRTAKFPANGFVISCARELKLSHADRARQHFHGILRAIEGERVDGVGTGNPQMNRNPGRNQNAMRHEQILLGNHAHGYRAIRILLGSKIILDKLPREVKGQRINVVRASQKAQQGLINLIIASGRNYAQDQYRDQEDTQFSPVHSSLSLRKDYGPSSFSTVLQRSHTVGYSLSSPTCVE